jgi:PTS system nitrogen regulatory IIA component
MDGTPVDLVFMIAATDDNVEYLQILSLLARTLRKPGVIEKLRSADTAHGIYDLLAHEFASEMA